MDASGFERKPSGSISAWSSKSLRIDDLNGELQFTLTRTTGWAEVALIAGVVSFAGVYGFLMHSYVLIFAILLLLGGALVRWINGPTTTLRVSQTLIFGTGNLHRWSSGDVTIPAREAKLIGWSSGGQNGNSGLYVSHGLLGGRCVLPGLSERQSAQVTEAIAAKFPQYKISNNAAGFVEVSFGN